MTKIQQATSRIWSPLAAGVVLLKNQPPFEPDFSGKDLRLWLIQELNLPRDDAGEDTVGELRELYVPAFPYLKQALEADEAESESEANNQGDAGRDGESGEDLPPGQTGDGHTPGGEGMEVIQIGDEYVHLPKENIADERRVLKATVDAYIKSMDGDD